MGEMIPMLLMQAAICASVHFRRQLFKVGFSSLFICSFLVFYILLEFHLALQHCSLELLQTNSNCVIYHLGLSTSFSCVWNSMGV
uniref:Uncharacterized protein n=1 Tax=Mandrillus leucophaeus TaxID=9568 RepID=A0A2K5XVT7_MANLE